jgi:hypothetical protein
MENLEDKIFESDRSQKVVFWFRYVDDILACFDGSIELINDFLLFINNLHPNIQFTLETEQYRSINFLDLTIKVNPQNTFDFSIYRKPTHSDITIPNGSCHYTAHKLAAFRCMIHRALTLPLSKFELQKEISIIKQIAYSNGYNTKLIDTLIKQKDFKLAIQKIYPYSKELDEVKFVSFPYFGNISEKIANIINKTGTHKVVFKSNNNILNLLFNAKDKTNNLMKSGIYKLNCSHCNAVYIGQTKRNFDVRYKEHVRCYKYKRTDKSNYAKHLLENGHLMTSNNTITFLHFCDDKRKLDILEAFEIYKHSKQVPLMNEQIDLLRSPLLEILE